MATTMRLIAKNVLAAGATSVTFSDIPSAYTDLVLVASARSARSAVVEDVNIRFNGDTTSGNYSHRRLYSTPTTAVSDTAGSPVYVPAASVTASTFGSMQVVVPNYGGSTAKSYSADIVVENNSGTYGDAFVGGEIQSSVLNGAAHPFARFFDFGVRQTHQSKTGQAIGQVHLDCDGGRSQAQQGAAVN